MSETFTAVSQRLSGHSLDRLSSHIHYGGLSQILNILVSLTMEGKMSTSADASEAAKPPDPLEREKLRTSCREHGRLSGAFGVNAAANTVPLVRPGTPVPQHPAT